jgi:CspA family cold shock protein
MSTKVTGVVKFFNATKGYGFIQQSHGADVFFHFSEIVKEGYKGLDNGETVSFRLYKGDKGLEAKEITSLQG